MFKKRLSICHGSTTIVAQRSASCVARGKEALRASQLVRVTYKSGTNDYLSLISRALLVLACFVFPAILHHDVPSGSVIAAPNRSKASVRS